MNEVWIVWNGLAGDIEGVFATKEASDKHIEDLVEEENRHHHESITAEDLELEAECYGVKR